jgi:hypothetical protein
LGIFYLVQDSQNAHSLNPYRWLFAQNAEAISFRVFRIRVDERNFMAARTIPNAVLKPFISQQMLLAQNAAGFSLKNTTKRLVITRFA